jgi:hypothetical protein
MDTAEKGGAEIKISILCSEIVTVLDGQFGGYFFGKLVDCGA